MPSGDENDATVDAAIDQAAQESASPGNVQMESLPPVAPDVVEQELGPGIDNIVPTRGYTLTPTVGLGGSAGSIQALGAFFEAMPADSGLVFVVVLHLSPEHESTLAELLTRHTAMPVVQAEDGMVVDANHVYVIPPGKHLASVDGHLRLSPLEPERGKRMAVDVFFRTLADTHGAHAAAVVLSGADGDGAIGIKRIKERGGLTVVQDPEEAEHEGMPRSAITTGMVDWVLKTHEVPPRLLEYFAREKRLQLPSEAGPEPEASAPVNPGAQEADLREVLAYLHTRTGRDFSYYKRATVLRRIARRMQINGADTVAEYLAFLRTHPGEASALLQDLLISVTNFFRDREAFTALEMHLSQLFRGKRLGDTVRVWVAACASGEEAYSVAMLLFEHARKLPTPPSIQVFATDLAEEALQSARDGVYPAAIATDVSEERLARFFTREHRGYRVRRELRETVLFAQHDLLKDSPFSKIDLVTCRNLLIYLNADAQKRALDIFHFSLMHRGLLFLGSSESVDETDGFFVPLDKKHRLFAAQPTAKVGLPVPVGVSTLARALQEREHAAERPVLPAATGLAVTSVDTPSWTQGAEPASGQGAADNTYLRMLAQGGSPDLIVNAQHDILYLSGTVGRFLQLGAGELTRDLLHLVQPALRIELRAALARAARSGQAEQASNLPLELDGQPQAVDIRVTPVRDAGADCFVVAFTPRPATAPTSVLVPTVNPVTEQLESELERLKRQLRAVQEQHEVSTEEQKAGNEELQAINEELRSASEELETSREELQAINEELTTVNAELKVRVDELGHANNDLNNLMEATNIATVFLDRELRVARYTPPAVALFNLIPTDVGRPLTDLHHRIDYPALVEDARQVLARLVPTEREVHMPGDGWFLARLQPYRTLDDHIAGVVLSFVDVTERRRAEEALRGSEEKYRTLFESIDEGFYFAEAIFDEAGKCVDLFYLDENPAAMRMTGKPFTGHRLSEMGAYESYWLDILGQTARTGQPERRTEYAAPDGIWYEFYVFKPAHAKENQFALVFRDVTERVRAEAALRESEKLRRFALDSGRMGAWSWDTAHDQIRGDAVFMEVYGFPPSDEAFPLSHFTARMGPEAAAACEAVAARELIPGEEFEGDLALADGPTGGRWARWRGRADRDVPGLIHGVSFDVTESRRAEEARIASETKYRELFERITEGFCIIEVIFEGEKPVDYRLLAVNPAFAAHTGLVGVEGKRVREFVPEHEQHWFDYYGEIALTGQPRRFEASAVALGDRWFEVNAFRVGEPSQRRVAVIFSDITQRRRDAAALRESEERLRTLADAVPQIIWANAGDGVANYFNQRWYEYSGLSFEQSYDLGWQAIVHPEDAPHSVPVWQKALAAGVIFDAEYRLRGADGAYRWFIGRNVPMRDAGGQVVAWFGTATDIHDRKRAEEAAEGARQIAEAAQAQAEAAGAAKDHFLAVLSHELRTPLMPITMALAMLGKRQDIPEPLRKTHEMIRRNVELEGRFIDDMLDVTRIARGKMEIVREPLDLHTGLERAAEVAAADLAAKQQQLAMMLEATNHTLSGDIARLQQVFWNLLKNASKFTPAGGAIALRSRNEAGHIVVEVTDSGIGMEAEALGRIFAPFEQADASITQQFGGLGLGLAIAKATVEAHGGSLRASSPGLGHGATFTVTLPLGASAEETAGV